MAPDTHDSINGDLDRAVAVDSAGMQWSPSPSGTVWRKRLHLVGPPESGQVTSVVRYQAESSFPAHEHPDGEEILVLEGVFSDDAGDWPAGTYLLNPEGFRHAPGSVPGCLLFVKLRQYPGLDRRHVTLSTRDQPWEPAETPGIDRKTLYSQPGYSDTTRLERWAPRLDLPRMTFPGGAELFVLEGSFEADGNEYGTHWWLRLPVGATLDPTTTAGCMLYIKEGGLEYLRGN